MNTPQVPPVYTTMFNLSLHGINRVTITRHTSTLLAEQENPLIWHVLHFYDNFNGEAGTVTYFFDTTRKSKEEIDALLSAEVKILDDASAEAEEEYWRMPR